MATKAKKRAYKAQIKRTVHALSVSAALRKVFQRFGGELATEKVLEKLTQKPIEFSKATVEKIHQAHISGVRREFVGGFAKRGRPSENAKRRKPKKLDIGVVFGAKPAKETVAKTVTKPKAKAKAKPKAKLAAKPVSKPVVVQPAEAVAS